MLRAARGSDGVHQIAEHLEVLEGAGLVSRTSVAQRRQVHLEEEVLDLMTAWIVTDSRPSSGTSDGMRSWHG